MSISFQDLETIGKPIATKSSADSKNSQAGSRKWPHNFHMSPASVPHKKKVYSIVRPIYGRRPTDDLTDLDVNIAVWFFVFLNVTFQAAVHLGQDYCQKELFLMIEKLIKDQREIIGLTTVDYKQPTWRSTTLLCDKAIEITDAKTYVFADSRAMLGRHQY